MELKDWLNSINQTKKNLIDEDPSLEKQYSPYIINRCFSGHVDSIMFANELNKHPNLAKKYKNCNGTPIFRQEMETMGRRRNGLRLGSGSSSKIYQFPLICYYASTNHKIQVQ